MTPLSTGGEGRFPFTKRAPKLRLPGGERCAFTGSILTAVTLHTLP